MKAFIIYEVYNREYDNCLLLQSALKHVGIEADIVYKMDLLSIKPSMEKRVIIIPNCYNDDNFKYYYYTSGCGNSLIINLQYEQVLSNDESNIEKHKPGGRAEYLYNLCWGENFKDFLISAGVDESLCLLGGALQLDFLKPDFTEYWIKRDKLLSNYGIDNKSEITLFISSFAYANNEFVNRASDRVYGKDNNADFRKLSQDSREGILDWFEKYLEKDHDKVIIYRKHPMEKHNDRLVQLAQKYNKTFYLIDDYNIKQWIFIADRILNWYSTSAVECVVSKKPFEILRPIPVDEKTEVVLFKDARYINTYDSFVQVMNSDCSNITYPFDTSLIQKMYLIDSSTAFDRVARWIKDKCADDFDEKYIDKNYMQDRKAYISENKLLLKYRLKKIYQGMYRKTKLSVKSQKVRSRYAVEDWEFQANLPIDEEKKKNINLIVNHYYEQQNGVNNV